MITIPGYEIRDEIYSGEYTLVYTALRQEDNIPVIIKLLKKEFPSPDQIMRFKREYQITKEIQQEGIIKVYSFEKYQNTYAIIFEDFGGESAKNILQIKTLNTNKFLDVAIRIVDILGHIHSQSIIHKDINPMFERLRWFLRLNGWR